MITELLITIVLLVLLLYYFTQRRPNNFPPGPTGIPVLGYLPFMELPPEKGLANLAKKYGNVCSVFFANYPIVILSGLTTIKDAFKDDRFSGRPSLKVTRERSFGKLMGIIFATGDHWMEQRRFTLKNLRDFGFGKGSMESLIKDEVVDLISDFRKDLNQPISLRTRFNASVLNSLWHMIAGERFALDDPKLLNIINTLLESFEKIELKGPLFFMPWLTTLAPEATGWKAVFNCLNEILTFLKGTVEEHKEKFDKLATPNDLIDVYLREIAQTTNPNSSFYKDNGDKNLQIVLLDLFAAGADTTSTTLSWFVLYIISFPNVQKKLQEEIDKVVGSGTLPSLSDRPKMPYAEAVIAETLRMSSITALSLFHTATETFEFRGYTIPKDTIVLANLWDLHHNKEIWGDPEEFCPERFIMDDGHFKKNEALNPFSTGKRVCLGESLARDSLFLFITSLCQKFTFEMDKNSPPPSLIGTTSTISKPKPYKVVVREREQ